MHISPLLTFLLLACNNNTDAVDTGQPTDGGAPDEGEEAEIPWLTTGYPTVAAPEIPWLSAGRPEVAPPARVCADGWSEVALDGGGHMCSPWPSGAREECDDPAEVHLPGTEGCAPVGSDCPTGTWPADVSDEGTLFVAPGGTGDGSRTDPIGSVEEAMQRAEAGDVVMLSAGTWEGQVSITTDVTLRGACPEQTTLTWNAATDPDFGVVSVRDADVVITDLTIADSLAMGVEADSATVRLEGVVVRGVGNHGIGVSDSALSLDGVKVSAVSPRSGDDINGDPIYATGASTISGSGIELSTSHRVGLWIEGTSSFELSDLVVFGMSPQASDNTRGAALRFSSTDAEGIIRRVVVEGGSDYGIGTTGSGSMTIEDAWLSGIADSYATGGAFGGIGTQGPGSFTCAGIVAIDVPYAGVRVLTNDGTNTGPFSCEDVVVQQARRATASSFGGVGVVLVRTDSARLERVLIEDSEGDGVDVEYGEATTLTDITTRRTGLLGGSGAGVTVQLAAIATLERAILEDAPMFGLTVDDSVLSASDIYVSAAGTDLEEGLGGGVAVYDATLSLSRTLLEDVQGLVFNSEGPTDILAEDLLIREVSLHPGYGWAVPINTWNDSGEATKMTLRRTEISGGEGSAITLNDVEFVGEDLSISGVRSMSPTGRMGFGLDATTGNVTLTRSVIRDVQSAGLWLGGTATLTDVLVQGVSQQDCVVDLCPDATAATGVYVNSGASATLTRVLIEEAEGVGLQVGGTGTASDVLVRNNGIGIDAVTGTLSRTRVSAEGNGDNEAAEAQTTPDWDLE